MAMEANVEVESIYKSIYQSDGNEIYLVDKLPEEKDENEKLLNNMLLKQLLNELGEEEKQLIELRYFREMTQMQVAKILGISQVQVSRTEKKILLKMRQKL
ncbi:rNA polymerase sigma factor [Roseburia sp. CAG:303]|nr:rNA polymerase sigma factor [Roseburia sp. CAG:303]